MSARSTKRDIVKMIVLWVTLLVLHRGYTLIPVTTVQLGEPVTFPCSLPKTEFSRREVDWYKQSAGEALKMLWTLKESAEPEFAPEFNDSRWKVNYDENFTNLTILRTNQEDEGIYHCGITEWFKNTKWTGTYLLIKGHTQRTSDYTVVQPPLIKAHSGDSVTLQCSVLSDSDTKTCPGDLTVLWFRAGSQTSHPKFIYTDRNRSKGSDPQRSCVYHFSKTVSPSDEGHYYCAVATCWEMLFGNGTKLQIEQEAGFELIALVVTIICLVISVILNIAFICCQTPREACKQFKENSFSQARQDGLNQTVDDSTESGYDLNYAALHFSGRKGTRGRKKNEVETEESVYSQVKSRV